MAAKAPDVLVGCKCFSNQDEFKWNKPKKKKRQFPITHKPEQINFTLVKGSESVSIPVFNYKRSFLNLCFLSVWLVGYPISGTVTRLLEVR